MSTHPTPGALSRTLGQRVRTEVEVRGLTLNDFATLAGARPDTLRHGFNGSRGISLGLAQRCADALGLTWVVALVAPGTASTPAPDAGPAWLTLAHDANWYELDHAVGQLDVDERVALVRDAYRLIGAARYAEPRLSPDAYGATVEHDELDALPYHPTDLHEVEAEVPDVEVPDEPDPDPRPVALPFDPAGVAAPARLPTPRWWRFGRPVTSRRPREYP